MKTLVTLAALLIATAAAAAEPPADQKPEENPEAKSFVLLPEWVWQRAMQTMNAQQALIERLQTENRNACGKVGI